MIFREAIESIGTQRLRVRNPYYLSLVLGLALLLGGAPEARARDELTLRFLPAPLGSNAESINKKSQIVGDNGDLPAFWAGPDATTLIVLPVPPGPFGSYGVANSINDKDQIVGSSVGEAGFLPVFWEGPDATAATMLPVPSGPFSPSGAAMSINDKGQIVGSIVGQIGDATANLPAFWEGPNATAPTMLPVPSGPFTPSGFALSINKKGQIVGGAVGLPVFWAGPDATASTILPVPTGPFMPTGVAASINEKGQIVGNVVGQIGELSAYLPAFWAGSDAASPTILPFPSFAPGPFGAGGGSAHEINDKGQIVGYVLQDGSLFGVPYPVPAPVLWEGPDAAAPTFLPLPPGPFSYPVGYARGINDKGQIVGLANYRAALWAEERTESNQE